MSSATTKQKISGLLSVSKKILMSLTGIFLLTFLVVHLSGNLLLLNSKEAFNEYSEFMETSVLIRVMEIVLAAGFIIHIFMGIKLSFENKAARPKGYKLYKSQADFFSRFMPHTGIVILVFLVLHIYSFVIPHRILGEEDTYELVRAALSTPWYSLIYIIVFILLGFHLAHGFRSAFQTLGVIVNKRIDKVLRTLAYLYAIVVPGGFIAIALYFLIKG